MKRTQAGFTLIELAIVLVIIGLLLGGVLKGQELINSAKVKNMASDFKNTQVYIYGYQDKYRALPGDDASPVAHVGSTAMKAATGTGNGVISGAWDGGTSGTAPTTESGIFWQHVRLANLAPGPTSGTDAAYYPTNADGGRIGVQSVSDFNTATGPTGLTGGYVICSAGILGKYAKQLDSSMDDGETSTGSMRAYATVAGGWVTSNVASPSIADATTYNVCLSF
ncbi:prepilin-type N-terminal cleavage/methylation domain-containing protein [Methylotenera sp.]|uniref:prepilin-type N-terminal cleavage/methylation domain-containing protein n=1 Tax=Methylotenera sp. TaxID=2051956 RepID=UPI00273724CC|nr:prepilin-type N-terminal cleavage/methylation domain-containing protein [Methylotenera sp.]MDP3777348.1 prepilin-type N-terminal cleavage/methylation domain-containing protein [Methylotenera sp.]